MIETSPTCRCNWTKQATQSLCSHSGTAVWRRIHSRLLFGCQGRVPWIIRSGRRFQCWYHWREWAGFVHDIGLPTRRAQLWSFRHSLCDHRWHRQGLPRDADCTGPLSWNEQGWISGLQAVCACNPPVVALQSPSLGRLIIIKTDWRALAAIPMSHFLDRHLRIFLMCSLTSENWATQ